MKISARNQIPGTVVEIVPGAVNGSIKVDIGQGVIVTSNITEEAIADLGLAIGDAVTGIGRADRQIGRAVTVLSAPISRSVRLQARRRCSRCTGW